MNPPSILEPAERLKVALATIGWSSNELARRLGSDHAGTRKMTNGRRYVPDVLLAWIEPLAADMAAVPVEEAESTDMDCDTLRNLIDEIGWNLDEATRRGAQDKHHMHQILGGSVYIPASFALYVQRAAAVVAAHPAKPPDWGRPGRHVA
jgi:hypothetical protein